MARSTKVYVPPRAVCAARTSLVRWATRVSVVSGTRAPEESSTVIAMVPCEPLCAMAGMAARKEQNKRQTRKVKKDWTRRVSMDLLPKWIKRFLNPSFCRSLIQEHETSLVDRMERLAGS